MINKFYLILSFWSVFIEFLDIILKHIKKAVSRPSSHKNKLTKWTKENCYFLLVRREQNHFLGIFWPLFAATTVTQSVVLAGGPSTDSQLRSVWRKKSPPAEAGWSKRWIFFCFWKAIAVVSEVLRSSVSLQAASRSTLWPKAPGTMKFRPADVQALWRK